MKKSQETCSGCPLFGSQHYDRFVLPHKRYLSDAYALPDGPPDSPVAFIGEALGEDEAGAALRDQELRNFVGRAGAILNKGLDRLGRPRKEQRVTNVVRCWPPNDVLVDWGWKFWGEAAVARCAPALDQVLWEPAHRVFVTLGVTATREVLKRWGVSYKGILENWHGYVIGPPEGPWVVPAFHPSFILHDKWGMSIALYHDIRRAYEVAEKGWQADEPNLVVDPPPEWFARWAQGFDPAEHWLAVDVETREKLAGQAEDEIEEDQPLDIVRINFAYNPDEGITVPWTPAYLPIIRWLLSHAQATYILWNDHFDLRCLAAAGVPVAGRVFDGMAAWHCLQSDVRKSLGFVAPYFSAAGPWKHLADTQPGEYAAKDAAQTLRIIFGLIPHLQKGGQLHYAFQRHCVDLDALVLRPAERRGPRMDRARLEDLRADLTQKDEEIAQRLSGLVPEEAVPLVGDWTRDPRAEHPAALPYEVERDVQVCLSCGAKEVTVKHVCRDEVTKKKLDQQPQVVLQQGVKVVRWFERAGFDPGSPTHLLSYIQHAGVELPKAGRSKKKKTDRPTLDAKVLDELAKAPTDNQVRTAATRWGVGKDEARARLLRQAEVFQGVLAHRDVEKVKTTYVEGALGRLAEGGKKAMPCRLFREEGWGELVEVLRGHEFHHTATTQRLSCKVYPLQGMKKDDDDPDALANGFRRTIVPRPGHRLVSLDFSGIETLLTGWFSRDPEYIKWGRRGLYSYLVAHRVGKLPPAGLSEAAVKEWLLEVKRANPKHYKTYKAVVLGTGYGRTVYGMNKGNPETFPTLASAQEAQDFYFTVAPKLRDFQAEMRNFAARNNYLGGQPGPNFPNEHPFGYIHWFWAVMEWDAKQRRMKPDGPDSNRVVSFFPQSTAFGILAEACLESVDPASENYIGDACGDPRTTTPYLALIHDEALLELPEKRWEDLTMRMQRAMLRPIEELPCPPEWNEGEHLVIDVEVKHSAKSWAEMEVWRP